MNTVSNQLIGLALMGVLSVLLLLAPIQAQTKCNLADQEDTPIFVLDRIELLSSTAHIS